MIDWLLGEWASGNERRSYVKARRNEAARLAAKQFEADAEIARTLASLNGENAFTLGTLADNTPVQVGVREIGSHGMVWGSSGAGKSYALNLMTEAWTRGDRRRLQLIDPKGETFLLKALAAAAKLESLPDEQRDAYASKFQVFDVTADRVTPGDLFRVPAGMSPALLAHLRTAATCDVSSHAFSDLMSYGMFLLYSTVINLGWGLTVRIARSFFLDGLFRKQIAAKVCDERLRDSILNLEITLPEQTRKAVIRQFDVLLAAAPARVSFGLSPSMVAELLPSRAEPCIFVGNYGPSPQRPPALARAMATNRLIDVLAEVSVREELVPELLLLEEVGVLVRQNAVAEYLLEASRTLRWKRLGIVCVAQDPANAIPKETATALLLNAKWLLSFECGRDEAGWLLPHMSIPKSIREPEYRRDFVSRMAKLPTQHAVFVKKGHAGVRLRIADVENPLRQGTRSELLASFNSNIAARSMVRIKAAEERIAAFEAAVFRDDVPAAERRTRIGSKPTASVEDFFERLARMRNRVDPTE